MFHINYIMKMENYITYSAILLIYSYFAFLNSNVFAYEDRRNTGLTSFPTDIAAGEKIVLLSNNFITEVRTSDIQHLTAIVFLTLFGNLLTEFPDFRPILKTLDILKVKSK